TGSLSEKSSVVKACGLPRAAAARQRGAGRRNVADHRAGRWPRRGWGMSAKHEGGLSIIEQLSAYVATESFDKLPDATVRAARRAILDTLGVMLAGSVEVTAARVRALIAHRRGDEEATIVGTPLRGSVEYAAIAHGKSAHALEYDSCITHRLGQ